MNDKQSCDSEFETTQHNLDTKAAHSLCKESHALTGDGTIGWTAKQDW